MFCIWNQHPLISSSIQLVMKRCLAALMLSSILLHFSSQIVNDHSAMIPPTGNLSTYSLQESDPRSLRKLRFFFFFYVIFLSRQREHRLKEHNLWSLHDSIGRGSYQWISWTEGVLFFMIHRLMTHRQQNCPMKFRSFHMWMGCKHFSSHTWLIFLTFFHFPEWVASKKRL